jgi:putative SOS response-associated peptidase YedK
MCGRDSGLYTWREVAEFSAPLKLILPDADPEPRYNRAPGQFAWVLHALTPTSLAVQATRQTSLAEQATRQTNDANALTASSMKWGLQPELPHETRLKSPLSKPPIKPINARIESVRSKPSFREPWRLRRCLIPASGYFEWQQRGFNKLPYYIKPLDSNILLFAGIWSQAANGQMSYSILTKQADTQITELHDRMPIMLSTNEAQVWCTSAPETAYEMAISNSAPRLGFHAIDDAIGSVKNDGPELLKPRIQPQQAQLF